MVQGNSLIPHVAVLLVMAAGLGKAYAADDPEALIREGLELRRHGEDAKAHGYFQRAYDLTHTPRAAAQLGLVNQGLGFDLDAEHYLTEALETRDPWVLDHREILEKSRHTVRGHLGKVGLRGLPPGATAAWSGQAARPVAADNVLWVAPGKLALTFSAPDRTPVTRETSVGAGESMTLDVDLPAVPQPVAAAAAAPVAGSSGEPVSSDAGTSSGALRIAGLITAGAGVAAGFVGIFVYRAGTGKANAIEHNANPMTAAPYDESNGNYKTLGNAGIGLMVGGGVALATGVALYLVGRSADAESTDAGTRVSLWYTPGSGAHVSLGGSF
jgi:hypothetical protein